MPVLSSLATAPDFSSIPTPPPTLSLEGLQAQLQAVVVGGRTAGEPFSTGLPALDAALGGGIPRGRITELTGALAVGKTALLRRVVASVLHTGVWVAWIDATRTLTPAPWADLGKRFVVIRLPEGKRAAWTADLLLRSGVFGLVVIDGAPSLSRVHGVRLAQLARERDAACVVLEHVAPGATRRPSRLAGTVRVQVALATPPSLQEPSRWTPLATRRRSRALVAESPPEPTGPRPSASPAAPPSAFLAASPAPAPARLQVTVEKGASLPNCKTIEVDRVVVVARRVCTDSEIPDRRGVARSARRVWTARGNSTDANTEPDRQQQEHPVTWGGLGVGAHDLYGIDVPGHPARLAAGLDLPGDRLPSDRLPGGGDRHEQELDRRTRDWTTYKGRRRAAESSFGRRGRREATRSSPAPLG